MLKASIVLWLLASIYGLEIVDVVKRDVNTSSYIFDVNKIQKDVKEKVNYLLLDSATDWKDTYVILSIMHRNASLLFQTKLTQELDNVRHAVETAHENSINATYCIQDTENKLRALKRDAELKFSECEAAGWKDFVNNYDIITKILQTGYRVLEEITTIQKLCFLRISYTYTNEGMKKVNAFRPINERCVNDAE
ncbi:hypothetical protein KM043_018785 [Ampulex compressa]|nr:hypothetical protein KM043_018785 [Ampulex compressa]